MVIEMFLSIITIFSDLPIVSPYGSPTRARALGQSGPTVT